LQEIGWRDFSGFCYINAGEAFRPDERKVKTKAAPVEGCDLTDIPD